MRRKAKRIDSTPIINNNKGKDINNKIGTTPR